MRLRFALAVAPLLVVPTLGCSSSGDTGGGSADAAADSSRKPADSGTDPFGGGGGGHDASADAGGSADASICTQLKAQVDKLAATARACNPSSASDQCNAQTNGPCCPISVSTGDPSAVESYDQAVKQYVMQCSPDCTMIICGQTPSNVCDGTGSSGVCR